MEMSFQQKIFTQNLRFYVSDKNQADIAKVIGVSPQTFNTWYKGKAIPRMGKIQKLADYFGIDKSDLIDDKSDSEKNIAIDPTDRLILKTYHESDCITKAMIHRVLGIEDQIKEADI